MPDLSEIKKGMSRLDALEKELNLKQLQINRLLGITQAINDNVSAKGLFEMYQSFLSWEMGVKKMALYFLEEKKWVCKASIGLAERLLKEDISAHFSRFTRLSNLQDLDSELIREFDLVIPVRHKETPLAYVFIGGFGEDEDLYNKVQFITTITNIIAVAIENKRLFKRQLEQERLKREMELAGEMQKLLIPAQLPRCEHYELASIYKPHLGVGGDYFDFIELENDRFAFCIGDISGKGVAAALLMANFQAHFQSLIHERRSLADLIIALNQSVLRITNGDKFITFFVAEYDLRMQTLSYVNAGHNPPAMAMNGKIFRLDKGCTILGAFQELPRLEVGELYIDNEALILTYTDGLTDIRNEEGEFMDEAYGYDFLLRNHMLSAAMFNEKLLEEIELFKGAESYPDDFTVLTCKIY
jgi:sigma-B regulation protein RsbU (phosphoserine phosphatase)